MGQSNVAKLFDRQHACHRFTYEWKHLSGAGMEEQWFIIHDEVLVERESACTFNRNRGVNPIDPVSNLMHIRPGLPVRIGHEILPAKVLEIWHSRAYPQATG
jgi:hypothetical protein